MRGEKRVIILMLMEKVETTIYVLEGGMSRIPSRNNGVVQSIITNPDCELAATGAGGNRLASK
jgi:hypothetical protein